MKYEFWIEDTRLILNPSDIDHNYRSTSKSIMNIEGGEFFIKNDPGLLEYKFSIIVPMDLTPFRNFITTDISEYDPYNYLNELIELKKTNRAIHFAILRSLENGNSLFSTNEVCVVDSVHVKEGFTNGTNLIVDIVLKEYKEPETKTYDPNKMFIPVEETRKRRKIATTLPSTDKLINSGVNLLKREGENILRTIGSNLLNTGKVFLRSTINVNTIAAQKSNFFSYAKSAALTAVKIGGWLALKTAITSICPIVGVLI